MSIQARTIIELMNFQFLYLNKLMENVPNERLYEKQLTDFNSAGWILGHLCVEVNDIIRHFGLENQFASQAFSWEKWFKNTTGKIDDITDLPTKQELMKVLQERYTKLGEIYLNLNTEQRNSKHPSSFLKDIYSTLDAWFAHHLTTHFSIHCGNLVVWKKLVGIPVNGY